MADVLIRSARFRTFLPSCVSLLSKSRHLRALVTLRKGILGLAFSDRDRTRAGWDFIQSSLLSPFDKLYFCGKLRLSGAYFIFMVNCSL